MIRRPDFRQNEGIRPLRILFVGSSLEPGRDGVGDYLRLLASACAQLGHSCALLGLNDGFVNEERLKSAGEGGEDIPVLRLPSTMAWSKRLERARRFCKETQPDWISLHVVPYAYQVRGLLYGLSKMFRELVEDRPLHLMFHELWIGSGRPSPLRFRLVGLLQRHGINRLLRQLQPQLVTTSNSVYAAMLKSLRSDAGVLPLFGNVPITPLPIHARVEKLLLETGLTPANRQDWWMGIFFGALHEQWKPEPLLSILSRAAGRAQKRVCLLRVGRAGSAGEALWKRLSLDYGSKISFLALGEQPTEIISQLLQESDFGVAASPWQLIGKSGTAAAMLDHGLSVIVTRDDFRPSITSAERPSDDPLLHLCDDTLEAKLIAGLAKRPPRARVDEVAANLGGLMLGISPGSS